MCHCGRARAPMVAPVRIGVHAATVAAAPLVQKRPRGRSRPRVVEISIVDHIVTQDQMTRGRASHRDDSGRAT